MSEALLSRRERTIWIAGVIAVAALIVLTHFTSRDPDSALYASLSARLAEEPVARWIAPEWWGFWPDAGLTGLWVENPAGIFLLPALMQRIGIPAVQAAYVVGVGAALIALLAAGHLIARVTSRADGRAALTLLQIMPLAFIFRIRANHEYPMLACLLLTLVGIERVSRSWRWIPLVVFGMAAALCIKGVFAGLVVAGAVLWIATNPTASRGSMTRQAAACAIGIAGMIAVAWLYDVWYQHATGTTFWIAYWRRQISPLSFPSAMSGALAVFQHLIFYIWRVLWHPAPWSLALLWALLTRRQAKGAERRAVTFVLIFAAGSLLLLSVSSRFAERYAFTPSYLVGACGAVAAYRYWAWVRTTIDRLDARVPALPAVVWTLLIVLRLTLGQWLPRVQIR